MKLFDISKNIVAYFCKAKQEERSKFYSAASFDREQLHIEMLKSFHLSAEDLEARLKELKEDFGADVENHPIPRVELLFRRLLGVYAGCVCSKDKRDKDLDILAQKLKVGDYETIMFNTKGE